MDDEPETLDDAIQWLTIESPGTVACTFCGLEIPLPDRVPAFMFKGKAGLPAKILLTCPRCQTRVSSDGSPVEESGPSEGWQPYRGTD